ncbi:MAG TPA: lysylphosphatidylglycerol synthase transmembrane domain-containing protein [Solirubrobacteraceae bacterium]|nr:lysylphosphatidylglycerol synthase transmembrane domain-containing protein [Solirubrobacteraceae bacterium]
MPGEEDRAQATPGERRVGAEEMPRVVFTRRRLLFSALFVISIVAFLYFVLPKLLGLRTTWHRIERGDPWLLVLGLGLEVLSFFGYVALFRAVFVKSAGADSIGDSAGAESPSKIGWRESYEITMSGLAATRLFASAGAGGIALTAWALRRSGLEPRIVACRMIAFLALLYGVYMATLVLDGLGLYIGVFPGSAPFAITVVPAIFGAVVIALFLSVSLLPGDLERFVARGTSAEHFGGRLARRLAAVPAAAASGVRTAIALVRSRDPFLLGAIAWWAFDIAVLWTSFRAFGASPPTAVVVMSYFVGMVGNTLPLPGGIGGVDGGMIGAFSAFGIPVGTSVVAVLAYRFIAFWLPTLPGGVAYLQLRKTVRRWESADAGSEAPKPSLHLLK